MLPYDRWFSEVKRLYTGHGEVLGPIGDNENWRELHALGYSPQQAVIKFLQDNQ